MAIAAPPSMPSMPGSGTGVPPEVVLVEPPEVEVVVVLPPEVDEEVEDEVEVEVDEVELVLPPEVDEVLVLLELLWPQPG